MYLWISFLNQCYWVAGSILGSLLGDFITFDTAGLDFALTALFVVIFTEQWLDSRDHRPALAALNSYFKFYKNLLDSTVTGNLMMRKVSARAL